MGNIEQRGKNTWRIGVQFSNVPGRPWVRQTLKYPETMTEDEQRASAQVELAMLEAGVAAGLVKPPLPSPVKKDPPSPVMIQAQQPDPPQPALPEWMMEPVALPTAPAAKPGHQYTISQLYDIWDAYHVSGLEPTTAKTYRNIMCTRILPQLGTLHPEDITPLAFAKFVTFLRKEKRISSRISDEERKIPIRPSDLKKRSKNPDKLLTERTIRNYIDVLGYMLEKCVELKVIRKNPLDEVKRPAKKKTKVRALDDNRAVELLRLVGRDPRMNFRVAVFLALLCTLRLGEVDGLSFADIDYKRGGIYIQRALKYTPELGNYLGAPKSEAGERFVQLPIGMLIMLRETEKYYKDIKAKLGDRWRGTGRIICNWDGTPVSHDTPSKWFRAFADANGFDGVTFHKLRSAHASILFANNIDALLVAYRMGHEDPVTTYRNYGSVFRANDIQAADIMQHLLERSLQDDPEPDAFP